MKRALAAGHVVAGLVLVLGWLLLVVAWAVQVLGNNCIESVCTFTRTEKTVAVVQALIAAPGLVALGFAVAQGARYALTTQASPYIKPALQTAGTVLAGWGVLLRVALWL
jgi:hypothetical protein